MIKIVRLVPCALFLVPALLVSTPSLAQRPFDGTWRTNMDQSKLSPKPNVYLVDQGVSLLKLQPQDRRKG